MVEKDNKEAANHPSSNVVDRDPLEGKEEEEDSDTETTNDSLSSHGGSQKADDDKTDRVSRVTKKVVKKETTNGFPRKAPRAKPQWGANNSKVKPTLNTPKKSTKLSRGNSKEEANLLSDIDSKNMKVHPNPSSEPSARVDDTLLEEVKEVDVLDEASNGARSTGSDAETANDDETTKQEDKEALDLKIEKMERRIEKLEEELREVAALEMSLYSVVPEHGSSSHKVHTPARRLSRLYIHACKHRAQDKRATAAKNTVSGLVMIAKACGNDVSRLTFWLSNTVVLREIISQTFGSSCQSTSLTKIYESNGVGKKSDDKSSSLKWRATSGSSSKQLNKNILEFIDDWQETRTFTASLEKVESWIFSRIVESIWWQTLTPNMQSPVVTTGKKSTSKQEISSINLWRSAFHDAFKRLCPLRAGGHECGCLPVLARMVMEQCVARLDVAMFNAILRESAHEIPTDPISDPIVDSKVLPIPAGDLSFGSGAQLKNSVGSWSRWLSDFFAIDVDDSIIEDQDSSENYVTHGGDTELKCFNLLNTLSDLLMLPKDMLMDRSVRTEVCPSISLPLLKRILCNFTPDEFCPDPVPGSVLEALNAECIVERRLSGETSGGFPYSAAQVLYTPPSAFDVAEKIAEVGRKTKMSRNASSVQRKGYTSDEELEEMDSPLTSILEKLPASPNGIGNGDNSEQKGYSSTNTRFRLLREVWLA